VRRAILALAATVLLATGCATGRPSPTPTSPLVVAAASDLRPAFSELGERFEELTGAPVVFSFGSSGLLAQQLIEGAPMDVYASADAAFVDRVLAAGVGDAASRMTYATGRLTIWSRSSSWADWGSLEEVISDPGVQVIAIANPEHAPYGRAAEQALQAAGVWEAARPRLVLGENVSDAQRLAATGNADVAIVALSLALAAGETGRWVLIDAALHAPLRQDLLVVTSDPVRARAAQAFVALVRSEEGQAVMQRFGFVLP
jgi:molybdate transport system substrate-binding protein